MPDPFEDVSRWPVSRYFREVVAVQLDGKVMLFFGKLNLAVGLLVALSLLFAPISSDIAWIHVVLFMGMPLVGFLWFVRDMPSPTLTAFEPIIREPWQRAGDTLFQLVPALLPWVVLIKSHVH